VDLINSEGDGNNKEDETESCARVVTSETNELEELEELSSIEFDETA